MHRADPTTEAPLVGRVSELDELASLVAHLVEEGLGSACRVCGAAGTGKTRLLTEATSSIQIDVAWGAADEAERGRPLAALSDALGTGSFYRPSLGDEASVGGDAAWLAIDRVVEVVEKRTRAAPLVLVLDDLQWADQATWLAAGALARRARDLGLLLLSSHRPLRPSEPPPVPLTALGSALQLEPLSTDEVLRLGTEILGTPVDPEVAAQLERGGGNPFFTIELARWMGELDVDRGSSLEIDDIRLPPALRTAVLGRVDALAPATVAVIRSAALVGRRTSVAELAALSSQPVDAVARHIEDLVSAGLLTDDRHGIAFRHDLVRAAVRAETPPSTVSAHALAATSGSAADPWSAKLLAEQTKPGDINGARVILSSARASGVAPEVAAELLLEVLRIGVPPEEEPGVIEIELVVAVGRNGDLDAASELGHRLLGVSGGSTDHGRTAELRRVVSLIDLGRGHVDVAAEALSHLAEGSGLVAERARADLYLTEVLTVRRPGASEDARRMRRRTEDPTARCSAELAVATHAMRVGRLDESIEAATAATAQAALEPLLSAQVHPEIFLANALFYAERFEEAEAAVEHARRAAERAGVVWPIPHHLANVAGAALRTGDLEAARTASREAIEWSLDTNQRIGATWPHVFLTAVAVHTGELDDARLSLAAAEADLAAGRWQGTEAVPWAAALVDEAVGDVDAAADRLVPMVELAHAFEWNNRLPLLAPTAARVAWLAGRSEAVDHIAELFESGEHPDTIDARAGRRRCRAMADGDVAGLCEAAELYEQNGSRPHAGTTLAEAAVLAARTGDHDRAYDLFTEGARPLLESIGAHGILTSALAACPVRLRRRLGRQRKRATMGIGALTPAERKVAELVSTGATNSEIAETLFVSRRTVESHLSRIYRKLDVSSRVRLAAVELSG
ncbi:MAG: AAA family ATPase [Iamia sp.]